MNVEVLWSGLWPNKKMVLTLPALRNFEIIARYYGSGVAQTHYFRLGRGRAAHFRR
jgi:hypothetical protein